MSTPRRCILGGTVSPKPRVKAKNRADADLGCWGERPASRSAKSVLKTSVQPRDPPAKKKKDREPFFNDSLMILDEYDSRSRVGFLIKWHH